MKKITKLLIACSLVGSFVLTSCSPSLENNVVQTQDKNIVSIQVKEGSIPDKIYVGEFDNAGIKLVLTYSDGSTEEISVTSSMLSQENKSAIQTPGVYTITILYRKEKINLKINIVPLDLNVNFYAYVDKNEYTLLDTQIIPYRHDAVAPNVVNDFYYNGIHYYFNDWDISFKDVKTDIDVYAQYDEINYYTVTFFNGNGDIIDTQRIDEGKDAVQPTEEMRDISDFTFIGWDRSYLNVRKDISVNGLYKKISSVIPATEISINGNKSVATNKNYTGELTCTTNSPDLDPAELVWSSSDPNIVSVENGVITTHNDGLVRISVSNDYARDTCVIWVTNLGSKENPLSMPEAMMVLDRMQELNATLLQKMFIKARVSISRSYYSDDYSNGRWNVTFLDYENMVFGSNSGSKVPMTFDESLGQFYSSVDECTITFECQASKGNSPYYYLDYGSGIEREYPVIHTIEYPDARELYRSSEEKVALSLNNTPNGYNFGVNYRPTSAQLSQPISWRAENESIISIEPLNEFATECKVTPIGIGETKLIANYNDISCEYSIIVNDFGSEDNPLTLTEIMQFCRNYPYYYCNSFVIEGEISQARQGNYQMKDGEETLSFYVNTENELLLGSTTIIKGRCWFYSSILSLENISVVSSTGGRERTTISVTPSQALEEAKKLNEYEVTYDYYEITGYVSYKTSDGRYSYLSDVQEALDEEPNSLETLVIYRLENHITNERTPVKTKIKITTTLQFYNSQYYENCDVISAEVLEFAPTTDFVSQTSLMVTVGESKQINITPIPSYHIVASVTYAWADENQQIATIDENGLVTGLSEGTTILEVTYEGITKNISIEVCNQGSLEYQECTSIEDYGIYLIASNGVVAKYVENKNRIGFIQLEDNQDIRTLEVDESLEWEIAKVEKDGENYYTIKNVGSGFYLNKGSNLIGYSNKMELWKIVSLEDGTFEIYNLEQFEDVNRSPRLRYNPGYGFGCYNRQVGKPNTLYIKKQVA